MHPHRSKEDHVSSISKSVFVTNFPVSFGPRDLWTLCEAYGKVVDVFIPNRLSKAGKRFAFVGFIKVDDMDRLIAVKDLKSPFHPPVSNLPTLVLDDTCVNDIDLSRFAMGKVKELNSIPNLQITHAKEGFAEIKLSYLGGLWVMLELINVDSKLKLLQHTGVNSWFDVLQDANRDFICDERVVWVDIEGIPLNVWSHATFAKIDKKWGEVMEIEESLGASFAHKRICIKTSRVDNILETFKVTFKGKVFMARAKELFTWTLRFLELKDEEYNSDDESILDVNIKSVDLQQNDETSDEECDDERVFDMIFGDISSPPCSKKHDDIAKEASLHSEDPFGVYDLLRNPSPHVVAESDPSLSHPPGFTPEMPHQDINHVESVNVRENCNASPLEKEHSPVVHLENKFSPQESHANEASCGFSTSMNSHNTRNGGSILVVLDEMIKVGKSMGYDMEGCSKDIERIIGLQGSDETKMDCISHMDVKFIWGNSNYQFVASDPVGNSGGILCVWEDSIFKKDNVLVSDNFIALYGTWIPTNAKVLIVVIYTPQSHLLKRSLWDYISGERFGSTFNQANARVFNHFISSSGLMEVKMEGYAFTWSHPSATKMSKLDRFLVSEGIVSAFPAITAVCLDRHLSDHRLILLNEITFDFGPTPFWIYHSWFKRVGFDAMLGAKRAIIDELVAIDKDLDNGVMSEEMLLNRMELSCKLHELNQSDLKDVAQKAKIKWAIKGDENSKFFHGIINKRRSQLSIRGVFVNGDWRTAPSLVKDAFLDHFASRFKQPDSTRFKLNIPLHKQLSSDQSGILDMNVTFRIF
ncbi:RNA-directed DNA polymerase, eukaryota, partial [Tanacetum coccineum]